MEPLSKMQISADKKRIIDLIDSAYRQEQAYLKLAEEAADDDTRSEYLNRAVIESCEQDMLKNTLSRRMRETGKAKSFYVPKEIRSKLTYDDEGKPVFKKHLMNLIYKALDASPNKTAPSAQVISKISSETMKSDFTAKNVYETKYYMKKRYNMVEEEKRDGVTYWTLNSK